MASSKTDIYNMALTMLGAARVTSPTDNSKNARVISDVYDMLRLSELRKTPHWNFAIKETQLAASATTPLFDMAYSYPLPNDFVALIPPYDKSNYSDRDWVVQGSQIFTDYSSPLNIRYVADISDTGLFDPLFCVMFAAKIAETVCDSITQSNSKIQIANERYKQAFAEASKSDSFDDVSEKFPRDYYWDVRL